MRDASAEIDQKGTPCLLSFCIPTYNRAVCLMQALECIAAQATADCEIVISDNGSIDETQRLVTEFARRFDRVRYVRHTENRGCDRNLDSAVQAAKGEYCWLFSDDDLLKPGAVSYVVSLLAACHSLIFLNFEVRDLALSMCIRKRWLCFESDRVYDGNELDRLLTELNYAALYMSNIVIKRDVWMSRDRNTYYDSRYIHTAIVFQKPLPSTVLVVADPLITNRRGNSYAVDATITELVLVYLPDLFEKTAVSGAGRASSNIASPWRHPLFMLYIRGRGFFDVKDYSSYIRPRVISTIDRAMCALVAVLPRSLANFLLLVICSLRRDQTNGYLS